MRSRVWFTGQRDSRQTNDRHLKNWTEMCGTGSTTTTTMSTTTTRTDKIYVAYITLNAWKNFIYPKSPCKIQKKTWFNLSSNKTTFWGHYVSCFQLPKIMTLCVVHACMRVFGTDSTDSMDAIPTKNVDDDWQNFAPVMYVFTFFESACWKRIRQSKVEQKFD